MRDNLNLIGKKLATYYEIEEKIGEGGMGSIYRGLDIGLKRHVAVKVLSAALANDRNYVGRFVQEARSLAKLKHPNLMQIYYVGQEEGLFFFVTEFIEGCTLAEKIRKQGRLGVGEALTVFGKVLSALHEVHLQGMIHRDIKPANIMLEHNERVVLMDFGLAKDEDSQGFTSAGVVVGTPEYMSPEQAQGETVDVRTDIYSLAIMLYQMLSGRLPFSGKSAIDVLRQQCDDAPAPISTVVPETPRTLEQILAVALDKDKEKRYHDLPSFAQALATVVETAELKELAMKSGVPGSLATEVIQSDALLTKKQRPAPKRLAPKLVAGAAVAAAAVILLLAAPKLFSRKPPKETTPPEAEDWTPKPGYTLSAEEREAAPRFIVILKTGGKQYPLETIQEGKQGLVYVYRDGTETKKAHEHEVAGFFQGPVK